MFRIFHIVVALITTEAMLLAASQQLTVQQPFSVNQPKPTQSGPPAMETMPMPLVAPLFIQDETTDSEITIISDSSKALGVNVVLSGPSGDQLSKKKITMQPQSQQRLRIGDLLETAQSYSNTTYGSVSLVADRPAPLAAQLSIVNNAGTFPADIEEEFIMLTGSKPANYRAVTSGLSEGPAIAIRSLSSNGQKVSIECIVEGSHRISSSIPIAPNQTLLVRPCNGQGVRPMTQLHELLDSAWKSRRAMGISVSSSASSEELAVFGIGLRETSAKGALSAIPFWDVNTLKSSTAIYPGVSLGPTATLGSQPLKLRASLANFGNVPRKATVLLSNGGNTGATQKAIATVDVSPNGVSVADLSEISSEAFGADSIVVQTDGGPGEVLSDIQAFSIPNAVPISVTLPWKDQGQFENGGHHPWTIGNSVSSTLILFNPDPTLKNNSIQITIYAGRATWSKRLSLSALTTTTISLNDIIQEQQADDKGQKLPKESSQGIVTWSSLSNPRIFGKLVQVDDTLGVTRAYACGEITSVCDVSVSASDPSPDLVGQQTEISINQVLACTGDSPCSCNDGCGFNSWSDSAYWSSADSGIASVASSSSSWGNYQGNSAGQTWGSVQVSDNNGCGASAGASLGVSGASNWADAFGFPTDNGTITMSQADFNSMVSNGLLPAAAGTIVLIPIGGEIVVAVAISIELAILTYQAVVYIRDHPIQLYGSRPPCTLVSEGPDGNGLHNCGYDCPGYGAIATFQCNIGQRCAPTIPDGKFNKNRDCL